MEYRRLGKTGIQISALSFGSWLTFGKQIGDNTAKDLMVAAYDGGVNFFDNAEVYANGESEKVMGNVLSQLKWPRSTYMISSKVFFGYEKKKPNQYGLSRKHILEGCDAALKRLQAEYIDLFFAHRPDKNTPVVETVRAMDHLIKQGKILYWGTSEWSVAEIMQAHLEAARHHLTPPVMEQPQYNVFERQKMEMDFLHLFKYEGLGTTIWSPLASGLLSGKYLDKMPDDTRFGIEGLEWLRDRNLTEERMEKVRSLHHLAEELHVSLPKLAIAWCLKNPNVSTVILGASKVSQLQETLTSFDAMPHLTDEIMKRIDGIMQNKPVLPEY
jgi:voltage-dependent potassium channel beta subunit